jgi:S-adenosylmethionine-dependent methyltransferase
MTDRNFDDLAEHFENKIYKGIKGKIRQAVIWRDLQDHCHSLKADKSLRVLDIGAGLGQFSIELAKSGHHVTYNDLSAKMMEKAQRNATLNNVFEKIQWSNLPYQDLVQQQTPPYNLILCHALLEWLDTPITCISQIKSLLTENGIISLCFYNPVGLIYRNLICGNFRYLDTIGVHQSDPGSLTPMNPCAIEDVESWLKKDDFSILARSGIRVFSDYVLDKRGGNLSEEDVLRVELEYSNKAPYKNLGRYYHILAKKNA